MTLHTAGIEFHDGQLLVTDYIYDHNK